MERENDENVEMASVRRENVEDIEMASVEVENDENVDTDDGYQKRRERRK